MAYIISRKHRATPLSESSWSQGLMGGLAATLTAALAPQALAQAATTLPEVNVQATSDFKADTAASPKFTAPLLDTAKSVTVIPSEVIKQTAAVSLTEALRTTPGITFGAGEGGNPVGDRPFLRGFDTQSSTYVDGLRDIAPSAREIFNIETVEINKGADSTFGGRGGAGGSINLTTKAPKLEKFVTGTVGLGSDHYRRTTLDGNWLLGAGGGQDGSSPGSGAAFRLNAMTFDADVAGRNGPDNSRWGIAPSLAFGLGTPTRVMLQYFHLQTSDTPDGGVPYNLPASFPASGTVELQPTYGGNRANWYGVFARDFRRDRADTATALIEHDFSSTSKLRNITRASRSSLDYLWTQPDDSQGNVRNGLVWRRFNATSRDIKTLANATDFSGELRAGGLQHRFNLGLELAREEADNDSYGQNFPAYTANQRCPNGAGAASSYVCTSLNAPTPSDPWGGTFTRNFNPASYKTDTAALYAFDTLQLAPQWLVNGGVRVDRYDTEQLNATSATVPTRLRFGREDTLVNTQLGLIYKPATNGSIYASFGTSSTPGGNVLGQGTETQALSGTVNGVANTALELKPEKNRSYEIGTKWDLLDKQLALTGAVFRIETTNARIVNSDGTTTLAGDKVVDGIELGFSGNVTRQLQIFGGYTLLDSEIRNGGQVNIGTTARPRFVPVASTGRAFPNTPRHSMSVWASYKPLPAWTVGGGVFYQTKVYGGYAYAANTNGATVIERSIPSYARLDAMVGYTVNRNFSLQLNVQNLADKIYYGTAYSTHYANMAPGRSATLTGTFAF